MPFDSLNVNLANKVANLIRQAILTGELKSGDKIPQDELAESFGVSRMPIREALVILNYEGLVTLEPRRGAWVTPMTLATVDESYTMRQWAEPQAIALSVPHLTPQDLQRAQQALEQLETAEAQRDALAFVQINADFHAILRSRCPWPKLLGHVDTLWKGLPPLSPQFVTDQMAQDHTEHREILHAAREHHAEEARRLMQQHIERSWHMARQHFKALGWMETTTTQGGNRDALY